MRNAYALLGLSFLIVFGGAYILLSDKAEAPTHQDIVIDNYETTMSLSLTSPAFEDNGFIPSKYTCDGDNSNPPLIISGVPEGVKTFVLLMDDPDIPEEVKKERGIEKFDHWAVYNISPDTTEIHENSSITTVGRNSTGQKQYTGPCPPLQYQPTEHRYFFKLYALDKVLSDEEGASYTEIQDAMQGAILESTELIGRYSRVTE